MNIIMNIKRSLALFLALILGTLPAFAKPGITLQRHAPNNIFAPGEIIRLDGKLDGFPAVECELTAILRDEKGDEITRKNLVLPPAPSPRTFTLDFGKQERGYHEISVTDKYQENRMGTETISASIGVMDTVSRSASEARDGNHIFGLKWWNGIRQQREIAETMTRLGLQWTRVGQAQNETTIITDFPINAVIKVERFPKELYDADRYGPLAEWETKFGRGAWLIKTLPKKIPYQNYLRDWLDTIPAHQNVFEIWNEPWDKMSPQDFATLSQWIADVILEKRPDAIIGPNFFGRTDDYEYDAQVIKAGGMKHMKMVALHPYAAEQDRAWLRDYQAWISRQTGRDIAIYITECGSHSTPEGPARRSELEQARRTVRQAIELAAEGVKAITPHWAGQSEKNRTYIEDWFGFVRKNEEPKPVLLAYANAARLIDGSSHLGDLWFGPQVAASLFEKNNARTLVLWTLDSTRTGTLDQTQTAQENTARKEILIETDALAIRLIDMMGREKNLPTENGRLRLTLDEAPVYLVGVGPKLAAQATRDLRADRWPRPAKPPRLLRSTKQLAEPPTLDGKFSDWPGAAQLALINPQVNGWDCSGTGYVSWDSQYLYIGADMRDNEMLNTRSRNKLYLGDSMELFVSTAPRDSGGGYGPRDFQFFLTPVSGEGKPIMGKVTDREMGTVSDIEDARFFAGRTQNPDPGWAIEVAIPWSALGDFRPAPGARLALEMRVNDNDSTHERWKIDPSDAGILNVTDPSTWSLLELQ
ncbi:sugar-binding protein [Geminisphaera colitermitum]|uniref:sugar-binding protein n=1 Tax=Geminisphaera colitermitum TaxID=1148786 RepID=UPI000158CF50|nr:sugar-binding protein [Geminisphaera colitermitum]